MATVYLAEDLKHHRKVALKVLRPELAATMGPERFLHEIEIAAQLQHPHILPLHDSGEAAGFLYYVMPYVEGQTLRDRLVREGGLPIGSVVKILTEVTDALVEAHHRGLVHRDIKPENVLLTGRHALVMDFGVAKAVNEATGRHQLTSIGVALGTPAYMAPEQATADPHLDHRVDIYAVGVMGYEMLTGRTPFSGATTAAVLAKHVTEQAELVSKLRSTVPPALEAIVMRCMAKLPADRFQSAEELLAALEPLSSTPSAGVTPTETCPVTAVKGAPGSRRMLVIGAAAGIVLVAIAAALWRGKGASAGGAKPDANVVAVLPFEFSAAPELGYLREGIVNLLEASLTGEGGPRAVASQTTIAQWKRAGGAQRALTEDDARTLARELGAGHLLRGSIVGTPANLILSGTLVSSGGGEDRLVQAKVSGPADSIATLAVRLAGQLMTLRVGEGAERAASLASVPPSALSAYLEGQQHLRAGRFAEAFTALGRALSIDSTFALAGMAQQLAASWSPTDQGTSQGLDIALRHRDKLGPRDLILLQVWLPGQFAGRRMTGREMLAIRERLVGQIADRPEGWYLLGDYYFHSGPAAGFSLLESDARAENAFRRAVALDPDIEYVWEHIAGLAWDPTNLSRYFHLLDSLGSKLPSGELLRALVAGDSASVRLMGRRLDTLTTAWLVAIANGAAIVGLTELNDSALATAIARPGDLNQRRNVLRSARTMYWAQGRPIAARRMDARLRELEDHSPDFIDADAILAAIFADGDSVSATHAAQDLASYFDIHTTHDSVAINDHLLPALFIGLWGAWRGDTTTANAVIRYLRALGEKRDSTGDATIPSLFAEGLRVVGSMRSPPRDVVEHLDADLREGPTYRVEPRAMLNLLVARAWEQLGDQRRAAQAAARIGSREVLWVMGEPALRDQGRMLLAIGDTAGSIRAWRQYLLPRTAAEPPQRKADDAIRGKLAELERKKP